VDYSFGRTHSIANGQIIRRGVKDHGAAVAVLAFDPQRKTVILVRQLRAAQFLTSRQEYTLEVIAGIVDDSDSAASARREALEEAGLHLRSLERIGAVWTMPGVSTERMTLYLAVYQPSDRITQGGGVVTEDEDITLVEIELGALAVLMESGEFVDMKTLALTQALKLRRPELFV
jgi:nudix-type nucleoside diphosphatase (YffH/AdpP family)